MACSARSKREQREKTLQLAEGDGVRHTKETPETAGDGGQPAEGMSQNTLEVAVTQTEHDLCVRRCAEANRLSEENGQLRRELDKNRILSLKRYIVWTDRETLHRIMPHWFVESFGHIQ